MEHELIIAPLGDATKPLPTKLALRPMPASVTPPAYQNKAVAHDLLFRAASSAQRNSSSPAATGRILTRQKSRMPVLNQLLLGLKAAIKLLCCSLSGTQSR